MYTVYGDMRSGNCYKIKMLFEFLGMEHQWQHVDVLQQQTRTEAFQRMNPNAKIPVMDLGDGSFLWESNAILNYLAEGTAWLPQDRLQRARVLQWQFFEQYSHEPYIATARFINKYLGLPKEREAEYHAKQAGGHKALGVMEAQLAQTPFLVGSTPTLADITLFAYTQVADEGGFSLEQYPHIQRWLDAVRALPNYVSMEAAMG
jgi:glutathione S-transferase